jgi:transcription initiation factor TFIIE subunit beta
VRNKAQLLTEIQRSTQTGRGVAIKKIKESWKDATTSIEEMEKDGDVLVIRNGKDAHMKSVFWNEIKPDEESGGAQVEQGWLHAISHFQIR